MTFLFDRLDELALRTVEHLAYVLLSTGGAVLVGVPLGIAAFRSVRWRGTILGVVGILQTIPSLAMLVFLLVVLQQIGAVPAMISLLLYALLPIVRNTVVGLDGVDERVMEAARGIGMSPRQQLTLVRLPLAWPVLLAGIRTAAVVGVGIATLSAFIGAGGLGQFINRGLTLSDSRLILLGAVPAAVLALLIDQGLGRLEGLRLHKRNDAAKVLAPLALGLVLAGGWFLWPESRAEVIRIGSKEFSESFILGEIMAQRIEQETDLHVDRRYNLGGTMICHEALVRGEIDLYPEYTGTSLTAIMKADVITDPDTSYAVVKDHYADAFNLVYLEPFGFNNTWAITVRETDATTKGWSTISDLVAPAPDLRAGWPFEFSERPDGYVGLQQNYGLDFGSINDMAPDLVYRALAQGQVDVIACNATDGRIPAFDLVILDDDRNFFPPYYAAPVISGATLRAHPEIADALAPLAGILDNVTMQRLNYQVDEEKRTAAEVAREFLAETLP